MTNKTDETREMRLTGRYMAYSVLGLMGLFIVVGLLIIQFVYPLERPLPFAVGVVLGSLLSLVKIWLLQRSIVALAQRDEKDASNYATTQFLIRQGITLVFLVAVVFLREFIGIFGAILGILTLQLSAYIANFIMNKKGHYDAPVRCESVQKQAGDAGENSSGDCLLDDRDEREKEGIDATDIEAEDTSVETP